MHLNNGASRRSSIGRSLILPLVAAFTGLVAACAIPLLTPQQQNSQYCEIEVQGPSGPPVFVQGTLLDPIAETSAEAFANASLVGLFVLGLVAPPLRLLQLPRDPRAAVHAAHACDPARLVRPGAQLEFELVLRTADAQALARALKSALDAPRGKCASPRASRGHDTGPDGRLEIEEVSVAAGCLYGRMGYRVDVRWVLRNAGSGDRWPRRPRSACSSLSVRSATGLRTRTWRVPRSKARSRRPGTGSERSWSSAIRRRHSAGSAPTRTGGSTSGDGRAAPPPGAARRLTPRCLSRS